MSEDSQDWEDWEETIWVKSMFSDTLFESVEECLEYDKKHFGFDLFEVKKNLGWTFYDTMKFINWARQQEPETVLATITSDSKPWDDEAFLQPYRPNDPLLYHIPYDDDSHPSSDDEEAVVDEDVLHRIEAQFYALHSSPADGNSEPYSTLDNHRKILDDKVEKTSSDQCNEISSTEKTSI